jgi:MFS family permease
MKQLKSEEQLLMNLFALSGIAALIYQVCWQRLLFTAFGVDIESITIIVSAFMLGLGVGALAGGYLADRFPGSILLLFMLFESGIGIFGLFSPHLIEFVATRFLLANHFVVGLANFGLLLFPTALMGGTLPMLVVYFHKTFGHVGISVGRLYFVNTLGASVGSFLVGFALFLVLTLNQTIYLAAGLNFLVAMLVWTKLIRQGGR